MTEVSEIVRDNFTVEFGKVFPQADKVRMA